MVTEIAKPRTGYRDAFGKLQEGAAQSAPSWLARLRESAMESFEELGFPTVKDEEWKYTNVAAIARLEARPSLAPSSGEIAINNGELARFQFPEAASSQLVFVNGHLQLSSLAGLPEGVVALSLSQALADQRYQEIARQQLARNADYVANGFTALNTAFIGDGAFVLITKNAKVERPLHLLFVTNAEEGGLTTFPRVLVVAEENSSATIVESYVRARDEAYFTNAVTEVVLAEGARLEHVRIQRESHEAFHIATTAVDLGANSTYDSTNITLGAQLSRHNVNVTMDHEGAECWVDGLYLVSGTQHADTHSVIDHRQPHCVSHQLYKGILDGKSRAVFNGKIFVRHDAQKTDAMQTNKNLLLSNEARVDTKPQLEILADDVKCAHGAAVGQIDEDELFYLGTRGIHSVLARNLLTYGFAAEVIAKIKIDSIKAQLDEAVLNRLEAKLEV